MTGRQRAEVLAPAGSYESMVAAFAAGADAVYIGGSRFGARAFADNLDTDRMCQAIDYAHLHGRKLFMTVNTLFKEQELGELYDYLLPYYERGLDAVIVQDLGAMTFIREHFPDLPVHASTQMTITSFCGAAKLKELGASRVVTARELSLEEIRQIHEQVDVEIESFVHGALCYCYSGQCLMSSLIGGRSGNRGRCAQPCRLPYEVKRNGKTVNGRDEKCVLSLKDLCTLDILPDILEAGVYSLKIEGRMKSPRYTAGVVSIYRKYVDRYFKYGRKGYQVSPADRRMLLDLFDRGGFTDGYYEQHNGRDMVALKEKPAFREANQALFDFLDETYVGKLLKEPVRGEAWLEPGKEAGLTLELRTEAGPVSVTVTGQTVQEALNQPMAKEKVEKQLGKTGNSPFVFENLDVRITGNIFLPVQALNELRRKGLEALEAEALSRWQRKAGRAAGKEAGAEKRMEAGASGRLEAGAESRQAEKDGTIAGLAAAQAAFNSSSLGFISSIEEPCQLAPSLACGEVNAVYIDADGFPADGWRETVSACHQAGKSCLLRMPHIFRKEAFTYFEKHWTELLSAGFDGIVVRTMEETQWLKRSWAGRQGDGTEFSMPLVFDASLYTWNHLANQVMLQEGAARITMPVELNSRELKAKGCEGQEILIYGRLPMMVSAQCIRKTTEGCSHRREVLELKDRMGKLLPVKNHCTFCYNTIYNASPLSLLGQEDLVKGLKPSALRMQFTTESPKEVSRCLKACADSFLYGRKAEISGSDFTRGHIKRGVE
ncbi:MAG: DUF3656 domain-containing protein [Lachnospiraceae bacterium]|nr:DUF3656 domain-containing protein [Lachnospiraceae bacterium]